MQNWLTRHLILTFCLLAAITIAFYPFVRGWMLSQSTTFMAEITGGTVNLIATFMILGLGSEWVKRRRGWGEVKGWIVFGAAILGWMLILHFAGIKGRFG